MKHCAHHFHGKAVSIQGESEGPKTPLRLKGKSSIENSKTTALHKCSVCPYASTNRGHLESHIRTHTGVRPYSCEECGKGFTQKGNYKRHVMLHLKRKGQSEGCVVVIPEKSAG